MAKITDGSRGDDAETICNRGVKVGEGDQKVEESCIQERNPAINKVKFKILVPPSSVRLEDNKFITEEGIRDRQNVGWNKKDKIVNAGI